MTISVDRKSLIVQSNRLIEAKYRLSVEEQKIIKILVSQIQKDDEDFKDYEFHIKDLAELLDMEHSNTYGVLRNITKRLVSRVLEFYDQEKKEFTQASWLSGAKYKEGRGTVTLHFDPLLKPLLLQLQSYFTKYELGQVLRFKGQYTIRFFEFRKSFLGRNKQEVEFTLQELRDILGIKKNEYKIFRDFKNRVLEPARLELLEKTGNSFEWEALRQGRGGKITGVYFVFDGEEEKTIKESLSLRNGSLFATQSEESTQSKKVSDASVDLLINCGVSLGTARELAESYDEAYIKEKAAIAAAHPEYVKNKAGFLIKAIQENWNSPEVEEKKRQEETRRMEREQREREDRLRTMKQNFDVYRKNHALKQYEQFSEPARLQFKEEYLATLNPILRKRYRDKADFGFEDPYFRAFLMKDKIPVLSLEAYLQQASIVLSPAELEIMNRL